MGCMTGHSASHKTTGQTRWPSLGTLQVLRDIVIGVLLEQGKSEHVIDHEPGRKRPGFLVPLTALSQDLIHHLGGTHSVSTPSLTSPDNPIHGCIAAIMHPRPPLHDDNSHPTSNGYRGAGWKWNRSWCRSRVRVPVRSPTVMVAPPLVRSRDGGSGCCWSRACTGMPSGMTARWWPGPRAGWCRRARRRPGVCGCRGWWRW